MLFSRSLRTLTLTSVLAAWAWPACGQLPSLGGDEDLPIQTERKIGDRIAKEIYRDPDYLDDPVLHDYVLSLWHPLVHAARQRGDMSPDLEDRFAWTVFLARDATVNAFALPGGYLGLHTGLIAMAQHRAEIAAVMAHELSHVTQRHIARSYGQQNKQQPWIMAAMILGAAAITKNTDLANAAIVGGQAVALQSQLNFSRDMEREADRVGFGILTRAGFEGAGMVSMFERLDTANRINDNGNFPYLRTHPLTGERMAEASSRVANQDAPPGTLDTDALALMMAARAKIMSAPGVDRLRLLAAEAQNIGFSQWGLVKQLAALYSACLAYHQLREPQQAFAHFAQLQRLAQSTPVLDTTARQVISLLGVEIHLGNDAKFAAPHQLRQQLQTLTPEVMREPRQAQRATVLVWARAHMQLGEYDTLTQTLPSWLSEYPKDAQAWRLLGQAYQAQGQTTRAVRAQAEAQAAELDYAGALDRLRAAQKIGQSQQADHFEQSILQSRFRSIAIQHRNQLDDEKSLK